MKEHPFIFRSERSGTWQAVEKGLNEWGHSIAELKCVAQVPDTESVISMVEAGLGYSVVSDIAAKRATQYGRIKTFAELPIERAFYVVCLASKKENKAISTLVDFAQI